MENKGKVIGRELMRSFSLIVIFNKAEKILPSAYSQGNRKRIEFFLTFPSE